MTSPNLLTTAITRPLQEGKATCRFTQKPPAVKRVRFTESSEKDRPAITESGVNSENVSSGSPLADRKSTRLNSSHANISYAVFCLEKKDDGSVAAVGQSFVVLVGNRQQRA